MTLEGLSVWLDKKASDILLSPDAHASEANSNLTLGVSLSRRILERSGFNFKGAYEWNLGELVDSFNGCPPESLKCFTSVIFHNLDLQGAHWEEKPWRAFCGLFSKLPNLKQMVLPCVHNKSHEIDPWIPSLLQQVQDLPSLSELYLAGHAFSGDLPLIFRQIGSMKHLQVLTIQASAAREYYPYYPYCKPETYKILADSLQKLPNLQEIHLQYWRLAQPQQAFQPLLEVLSAKDTLKKVHMDQQGHAFVGDPNSTRGEFHTYDFFAHSLTDQQMEALQFFPRIHQAMKDHNLPEDLTFKPAQLEQWIQAMTSLNDRVDCIHYLFSKAKDLLVNTMQICCRERAPEESLPCPCGQESEATPERSLRQMVGTPPSIDRSLYVFPALWDTDFVQDVKQAFQSLKTGRRANQRQLFVLAKEMLASNETQKTLWKKASDEPAPCPGTAKHQKWTQGLTLLTSQSLDDLTTLDCSALEDNEIRLLVALLFPSLEETMKYAHIDPINMTFTVKVLRTFLQKQADAAAHNPAAVWPHYDARWKHMKAPKSEEEKQQRKHKRSNSGSSHQSSSKTTKKASPNKRRKRSPSK